jgi:hypothetical protein
MNANLDFAGARLAGPGVDQAEMVGFVQLGNAHGATAAYFLNNWSNAARASFGERGAGTAAAGDVPCAVASRATVTRGLNQVHSFGWSFDAIRTGIGFKH